MRDFYPRGYSINLTCWQGRAGFPNGLPRLFHGSQTLFRESLVPRKRRLCLLQFRVSSGLPTQGFPLTPTQSTVCIQRWRSSIQSAKTRPGADCGSDHELFIVKFRLKLKKVGKTTRPFRYDLNQNPYDYTVEVRNIFKGLGLTDRVPDELWTEVRDIVQETGIKTIPMENKCKKAKWLSEEALQIAPPICKRSEKTTQGTSPVVRWLRLCLPTQRGKVRSLVGGAMIPTSLVAERFKK